MASIVCNTGPLIALTGIHRLGLIFQMRDNGYWIHDHIIEASLKEANETWLKNDR